MSRSTLVHFFLSTNFLYSSLLSTLFRPQSLLSSSSFSLLPLLPSSYHHSHQKMSYFFPDPSVPEAAEWVSDNPLYDGEKLCDEIMAEEPFEGLALAQKTLEKETAFDFPSFAMDPVQFNVQLEAFIAKQTEEKEKRKSDPESLVALFRNTSISNDWLSASTENFHASIQTFKRTKLVEPQSLPLSSGDEYSPISDNDDFFSECGSFSGSELFDFGDEAKPTPKPYLPSEIRRQIWSYVVSDLKRCNDGITTFSNGDMIDASAMSPYVSPISYLLIDRATSSEFTDALYEDSSPLVLYVTAAGIYINEHDKKCQPGLWELIFESPRQIWLAVRSMEIRIQGVAWKTDAKADDKLQKNLAYLAAFLNRTHFSKLEELKIGIYLDTGCNFNADRATRLRFYLRHMESVRMQRNSHLKIPAVTVHGIEYLNHADPTIPRNAKGTIMPYDSVDPKDLDESVLYLDFVAAVMTRKQKQSRRGVSRVRRANGSGKGFFVSPTLQELRRRERRAKEERHLQGMYRNTTIAKPWTYCPVDALERKHPISQGRGHADGLGSSGLGPEFWDRSNVSVEENSEAIADMKLILAMEIDEKCMQ